MQPPSFRAGADEDIPAMVSLQAGLWTVGDAMGRSVRDVEEERMRLERAASLAHCGKPCLDAQDLLDKMPETETEKGGNGGERR